MIVKGIDLNRDGIPNVLQQPSGGYSSFVWRTSELRTRAHNTPVRLFLFAYGMVVRTLRCPFSALMRWGEGHCAALPRGLWDRRELWFFFFVLAPWGAVLVCVATCFH